MSLMVEFKNKYPLSYSHQIDSCAEGWLPLLVPILEAMEDYNKKHPESQISFLTIKEKYGALSISMTGCTEEIFNLIETAEDLSASVCETCGRPGESRVHMGWHYTSCDKHERT